MRMKRPTVMLLFALLLCLPVFGSESIKVLKGKVVDSQDAMIPEADVVLANDTGVIARTKSLADGTFKIEAPQIGKVIVSAPGFSEFRADWNGSDEELVIRLNVSAKQTTVDITASLVGVPTAEQPTSASVIDYQQIESSNESSTSDLLRDIPGLTVAQTGEKGGVTSVFTRGGNSNFNLVLIDGVPANLVGGYFDFSKLPSFGIDHIEVDRGSQTAVFGSYSNSDAINVVSREGGPAPAIDLLGEDGTYNTRRFGGFASGMLAHWGLAGSAARIQSNGPVTNSDYRNDSVLVNATHHFGRQFIALRSSFFSTDSGSPGPWGSDPAGLYPGIDTVSRNKDNTSVSSVQYHISPIARFREELTGSVLVDNEGFISPYGDSFEKDIRGFGETRSTLEINQHSTVAFGVAVSQEEEKDTYITDSSNGVTPINRRQTGIYAEHRLTLGTLIVNTGVRGEIISTDAVPADAYGYHPAFPANTLGKVDPKIGVAWIPSTQGLLSQTKVHSTFGTGIRPPSGMEIAYTSNPHLKPERTESFDAGVEQGLFGNRASIDLTYYYNRYKDLIVTLGGSLTHLSSYSSDNIANSRAQGLEVDFRAHPLHWITFVTTYTFLDSELLALNGSTLAQMYYKVGQPLIRRPDHSGSASLNFLYKNLSLTLSGQARNRDLDVEPNYGASAGLYYNPGYAIFNTNLNYRLPYGLSFYANLKNLGNRRYEEVFGYPSPRFNFVSGMKWSFGGKR